MVENKDIKALFARLVNQLEAIVPYADACYIENTTHSLSKDKTGIEANSEASAGVKIRAFDGYQYHEVCVQGWQPPALQAEVQLLLTRLKSRAPAPQTTRSLSPKIDKEMIEKDFSATPLIDPESITPAEKAHLITRLHEQALAASDDIINCRVSYREEEERRVYVNRNRKLTSRWTGCTISIMPFVRTPDGQTRYDHHSRFANGFEVKSIPPDDLAELFARAPKVRAASRMLPGKYTCVLSPNVAGILAHESFGHGMESDTIAKGRAKAEEYLGKRIAPAAVNICDDPGILGAHGSVFFDDEGILPRRVFLVKSGIVTEPMTESLSAWQRNYTRSCNGRAEAFDHKVYARMTNTFFLPGKDDPKQMVKGVRNGFYLHHAGSGMEDPKGWGVQVAGVLCERIKNGKLTGELFYEASISGYLPVILGNIAAVGKDFSITKDAGFCGKGHKEWVRVSSGGPHLLIKELDLS